VAASQIQGDVVPALIKYVKTGVCAPVFFWTFATMLFSDSYFTIGHRGEGIFKDRGSKFIGCAIPVISQAEITEQLAAIKKEHPSARHHCFAWRIGADQLASRSSDDGEPSGSAGKPILNQIQSHDLTNVLVVVIRYFGGTLLGVGGLINAYRQAASLAIENSGITERFILSEYSITFEFTMTSPVMKILKEFSAAIISQQCNENNTIVFRVKKMDSEKLEDKFRELYTTKLQFLNML
jgi:uncharacterized YigZ family protein